jgi:hypothetical protein
VSRKRQQVSGTVEDGDAGHSRYIVDGSWRDTYIVPDLYQVVSGNIDVALRTKSIIHHSQQTWQERSPLSNICGTYYSDPPAFHSGVLACASERLMKDYLGISQWNLLLLYHKYFVYTILY